MLNIDDGDGIAALGSGRRMLAAGVVMRTVTPMTSSAAEPDAGTRAQQVAEAHLAACWEAEELAEDDPSADTPACAPFDGCPTCEVREVLYAAWPVFTADAAEQLRAAGFDEAADVLIAGVPAPGCTGE